MEWVRGTAALERRPTRPVLTIGNFDGLHLGHRAIMDTVIERARILDGEAVVMTFDPHPRKVLRPEQAPRLLATLEQKLEVLEEIGVDMVIVETFDEQFARLEPQIFVEEYIYERVRPMEVFVGYDFHFGRDREGSMRLLTETGPMLGFAVTIIPEVKVGGRDVNSTRIRDLLAKGNVEEALNLLGRPFGVRSRVQEGDRRGRELGFPTANLDPENEVLPGAGVYAGEVRILDEGNPGQGERFPAVINVGYRPTFRDGQGLLAEAHLLDFDGDLYGRSVELCFMHRLRSERKFPGPEALREQIARDVVQARAKLGVG
ncbi:MAG: bifunctional riboflavin kinase/FAD synthetase [Deltaproteobacteria bacterium]|nr:bifunctional riboflavin kinase/FAD synthetase [Deltaproteobacteria bacterium]